jgi:hypothetical protein
VRGAPRTLASMAAMALLTLTALAGISAASPAPAGIVTAVDGPDEWLNGSAQGPQNQQDFTLPEPPGGVVWDVVSASVTVSTSHATLSPSAGAYLFTRANPDLPELWNPNYDVLANVYAPGGTATSATAMGGYGSGPIGIENFIRYDQTIHLNADIQAAFGAQLVSGESASYALEYAPESTGASAVPLYQWDPPIGPLNASPSDPTTYAIPNSDPPAGELYRVENAAAGIEFTGSAGPARLARVLLEPSGTILCSIGHWPSTSEASQALCTGGYSTAQAGPDSGPGQFGTQTVWSSQMLVFPGEWLEAQFAGTQGDGGLFAVMASAYAIGTQPANVSGTPSGALSVSAFEVPAAIVAVVGFGLVLALPGAWKVVGVLLLVVGGAVVAVSVL